MVHGRSLRVSLSTRRVFVGPFGFGDCNVRFERTAAATMATRLARTARGWLRPTTRLPAKLVVLSCTSSFPPFHASVGWFPSLPVRSYPLPPSVLLHQGSIRHSSLRPPTCTRAVALQKLAISARCVAKCAWNALVQVVSSRVPATPLNHTPLAALPLTLPPSSPLSLSLPPTETLCLLHTRTPTHTHPRSLLLVPPRWSRWLEACGPGGRSGVGPIQTDWEGS